MAEGDGFLWFEIYLKAGRLSLGGGRGVCRKTQLLPYVLPTQNSILHVIQEDKIPDTEVLEISHCESVFSLLKKSQLRWAGHVHRMADTRIPKQLLYGELACGSRKRGRPKLRYKDTLKASMKDCLMSN